MIFVPTNSQRIWCASGLQRITFRIQWSLEQIRKFWLCVAHTKSDQNSLRLPSLSRIWKSVAAEQISVMMNNEILERKKNSNALKYRKVAKNCYLFHTCESVIFIKVFMFVKKKYGCWKNMNVCTFTWDRRWVGDGSGADPEHFLN